MISVVFGTITLKKFIEIIQESNVVKESLSFKFKDSKLQDKKEQYNLILKQIKNPFFLYHAGQEINNGYTINNNLNEYIDNIKHINNIKLIVSILNLNLEKYKELFETKIRYLILVSEFNKEEEITDLITTTQIFYDRLKSDYTNNKTKKTIDFEAIEEIIKEKDNFKDLLVQKNQKFIFDYYLDYLKNKDFMCDKLFQNNNKIDDLKLNNKCHIHKCLICSNPKKIYVDKTRNNLDKYIEINSISRTVKQVCNNCTKSERGNFEFEVLDNININNKKEVFYYMCKIFKSNNNIVDTSKFEFTTEFKFEKIKINNVDVDKMHIYYCPFCNKKHNIYLQQNKQSNIKKILKGIYNKDNKLEAIEINCEDSRSHFNSHNFRFYKDEIVLKAFKEDRLNELLYYIAKKVRYYSNYEFEYINNNSNIAKFNIEKLINSYV